MGNDLKRGLKERHIQLIALGGSIGAGLFLGSASAIQLAGPAIILVYLAAGIFVFFLLRALGELAVAYPLAGSFSAYANIFFGPLAGYLTGWTYWFMWTIICIAEITAIGVYMSFWLPELPQWVSSLAVIFAIAVVNMVTVEAFGEFEFWLSLIKVTAVSGFITIGLGIIFLGAGNGGVPLGLDNLFAHGGFFPQGVAGMVSALPMVIFAYTGVEIIGVTAGEAKEPEKVLPAAINNFFLRILLFYAGSLYVILSLYPWTQVGAAGSPFVGVLAKTGVRYAAAFMNFVVITAAMSSFNSGIYSSARMLYSLAQNGSAPKFLSSVNRFSVPLNAILFSSGCLLFGAWLNYAMPAKIFVYATSISVFAGLFIWYVIFAAQLKFRKSLSKNQVSRLKYPMPFAPLSGLLGILALVFVASAIYFNADTRRAIIIGPLWLAFLTASYYGSGRG